MARSSGIPHTAPQVIVVLVAVSALLAAPSCGHDNSTDVTNPTIGGPRTGDLEGPDRSEVARRGAGVRALAEAIFESDQKESFRKEIPSLVASLSDEYSEVRGAAATALGHLERVGLGAVEDLASRVHVESEAWVRMALIDALSEIAPPPRAHAEAWFGEGNLKPAPVDPDPNRTARAWQVGLEAVNASLDDDSDVRKRALTAAGRWGRNAHGLERRIARFLRDPDAGTRYVAVIACRILGVSADVGLEGLLGVISDAPRRGGAPPARLSEPAARRAAVVLIGDLGPAARSAAPTLRTFPDDPEIAESVPAALRKIEGEAK